MVRQVATALCSAVCGFIGLSSVATAQQKTETACLQEWHASATAKQNSGVSKKEFVARCRDGGTPARPASAPATPVILAAGAGNAAGDRQVYTSIKDIMDSIIDPSADTLWGAAGTVIDKEGVHELLPKTQEEWLDLRRAAVRIIEGANLLMNPGREVAPAGTKSEASGVELEPAQIAALIKKKRKSFDAFAKALQGVGLETLRAGDAKNADLLLEIGARMEDVCESCHQTFWYPQEKGASTRPRNDRLHQNR